MVTTRMTNSPVTAVGAQTNLVCAGRKLRSGEPWDDIIDESVAETRWRELNSRDAVQGHSATRNGVTLIQLVCMCVEYEAELYTDFTVCAAPRVRTRSMYTCSRRLYRSGYVNHHADDSVLRVRVLESHRADNLPKLYCG